MAATATRPLHTHRHHPYILPQNSPSTSSIKRQAPAPTPPPIPSRYAKAFSGTLSPRPTSPERARSPLPDHSHLHPGKHVSVTVNGAIPPSPPRSRRDASETPSIGTASGLGVAFGGSGGGKWWDEEIPPPPASLTAILDSFRQSGQGDRDLLLAILGAKKAEEERLTALISTRLTILQARLSLHSAAAALNAQQPLTPPEETSPSLPNPEALHTGPKGSPPPDYLSPRLNLPRDARDEREARMAPPPLPQKPGQSLQGLIPRELYAQTPQSISRPRGEVQTQAQRQARSDLPPVQVGRFWTDKRNTSPESRDSREAQEPRRVPIGQGQDRRLSGSPTSPISDERERKDRAGSHGSHGSSGSESRAPGLDMLLDAGMRDQEMA